MRRQWQYPALGGPCRRISGVPRWRGAVGLRRSHHQLAARRIAQPAAPLPAKQPAATRAAAQTRPKLGAHVSAPGGGHPRPSLAGVVYPRASARCRAPRASQRTRGQPARTKRNRRRAGGHPRAPANPGGGNGHHQRRNAGAERRSPSRQ